MVTRTVTVRAKGDISDLNRAFLQGSAGATAFSRSLDTSTDRMTNLVQGSLALGPALITVGSTAVPVLSGLTNQLAFAAAGAGVAAVALSGVGEALKAIDDYANEQTDANLEKLNNSLRTLGPAGREFAFFLQQIRPEMQLLQDAAQGGLLPGLEDSLREFMLILPKVQQIIFNTSSALGELAAEGSRALTSDEWREFFTFLEREARPTLLDMGRTVGNFSKGFAELWMAFDPLSDQFSKSFLQMSRDFSGWADGLSETDGFQEFVDYIRQNGPQAWDTLGALAGALIEIVEAAAPVGAAALPVIEAVSDAIASIADSDLGPAVIGVIALTSAYSRLLAVSQAVNSSAMGGLIGKSSFGSAATAAKDIPSATRAMLQYDAAAGRAAKSAGDVARSGSRLGTALGGAGKLAGGAGGLAFVMSDLDNQLGLTNTAMLALAGSMVGPWGTAIGGAVGLVMDLSAASGAAADNIAALTGFVVRSGTNNLDEQYDAYLASISMVKDEESAKEADKLGDAYFRNKAAAQELKFEEAGLSDALAGTTDATRDQIETMLDNAAAKEAAANATLAAADAEIGLEAAYDAATEAAKENGRTNDINTEAGQNNKSALIDLAQAWAQTTDEYQRNGDNQERVREQFMQTADAMDYGREEAKKLFEQWVAFPPEVRTEFVAAGAEDAIAIAVQVAQTMEKTPEEVETELRALNYTEEDIPEVLRRLQEVNDKKTEPKISANADKAKTVIEQVRKALAGLKDKSITVTTYKSTVVGKFPRGIAQADGGYIAGPGGPRDDLIPAWLSNGEFVVNAAATKANLGLLHSINNSRRFADGGAVDFSMAQAFGPSFGSAASTPQVASVELVGAEVGMDRNGITRFVRGQARVVFADAQNQQTRDFQLRMREGR